MRGKLMLSTVVVVVLLSSVSLGEDEVQWVEVEPGNGYRVRVDQIVSLSFGLQRIFICTENDGIVITSGPVSSELREALGVLADGSVAEESPLTRTITDLGPSVYYDFNFFSHVFLGGDGKLHVRRRGGLASYVVAVENFPFNRSSILESGVFSRFDTISDDGTPRAPIGVNVERIHILRPGVDGRNPLGLNPDLEDENGDPIRVADTPRNRQKLGICATR